MPHTADPPANNRTRAQTPVRDHRFVQWSVSQFLERVGGSNSRSQVTMAQLGRDLNMSGPTVHKWDRDGRLPYLAYKAMVAKYALPFAAEYEESLTVELNTQPARLSPEVAKLVKKYDAARAGARVRRADGSMDVIPGGAPEPEPADARGTLDAAPASRIPDEMLPAAFRGAPAGNGNGNGAHHAAPNASHGPPNGVSTDGRADAPEDGETVTVDIPGGGRMTMTRPRTPETPGEMDVLISLCLSLKLQRDQALKRLDQTTHQYTHKLSAQERKYEHQVAALREDLRLAQEDVVGLRKQRDEWQQLAESVTHPDALVAPAASTPVDRHRVETRLREKAPSLVEEVQRLPFATALLS